MRAAKSLRSLAISRLRRFVRDESGVMTVYNLFLTVTCCAIGAAGLDVTHFYAARTELQTAADIAAHSALFRRNQRAISVEQAKSDAIDRVSYGMPETTFGRVIESADIVFGTYDEKTRTFTPNANSRSAVQVSTGRDQSGGNPVRSFLFRIVGVDQMDVGASAIATTYTPRCLTNGFTSNQLVDVRSNNAYYKGFCMHSNSHVELNMGNSFELGTTVSMPSLDDFYEYNDQEDLLANNAGLEQALREDRFNIEILDRVALSPTDSQSVRYGILEPGNDFRPDYVTQPIVMPVPILGNNTTLTPSSFSAGYVHQATCLTNSQKITLQPGSGGSGLFSNFVLMTNCQIEISGKVDLQSVVLYTTNISPTSVQVNSGGGGPVGLWLGKEDPCLPGGGAQIITHGGFKNSAKLTMSGGQIIALGEVNFAADAAGNGASIIANGKIGGTSNMSFSGCTTGMEDNFTPPYFRLAL